MLVSRIGNKERPQLQTPHKQGWEIAFLPDGTRYFVNITEHYTTFDDPRRNVLRRASSGTNHDEPKSDVAVAAELAKVQIHMCFNSM